MSQRPVSVASDGPFDLPWLIRFLAARAAPTLEAVSLEGIRRAVRVSGRPALVTTSPVFADGGAAVASEPVVQAGSSNAARDASGDSRSSATPVAFTGTAEPPVKAGDLEALVRRMLDLTGDLAPFRRMAASDPLLAPLVAARPGIRLPQIPDPFEAVVRAILGQQVSVAAARTMTDRLVALLGDPVAHGFRAFPDAQQVAATPEERLARLGLTRAKARALRAVAQAVARGDVEWARLAALPFDEAVTRLCALPGVGPWTAAYVRMRGLADHDAFPATDLGVIRTMRRLHPAGEALSVGEIQEIAERWRPWRGYATVHLWSADA